MAKRRCAECGDTERPRGRWSPYFCEPCDLARMKRLDKQFQTISESMHLQPPYKRIWLDTAKEE